MPHSSQGKGTVGYLWDTSGIWPGPICVLSTGIVHLAHLLSASQAARKSYTWSISHVSWGLGSEGTSGEGLGIPCGSGEPQGQRGCLTVRDGDLMRSDGRPCALVRHLWCDLMQEKGGEDSTSLTEHDFSHVSFSFTNYTESVCCPNTPLLSVIGQFMFVNCVHFFCFS